MDSYEVRPVGRVVSDLRDTGAAPRQGHEGAPDAWLVFDPELADAFADLHVGDAVVVLTWLHLADRDVLSVHPRGEATHPVRGVFSTRSPSRPNPIGLHEVEVREVDGHRIRVGPLEAVDGTPIVDVKSALGSGPPAAPRTRERRILDTRRRLRHDVDLWVATADGDGRPHLVPLSFMWDGEAIWVSTAATSRTGRNLAAGSFVRLGIGHTRDVVMVDATATVIPSEDMDPELADRFAASSGFEPRGEDPPCPYTRLVPRRIQAWREANEIAGRDLLDEDGTW